MSDPRKRLGIRFEGFESLEDAKAIAAEGEAAGASSIWMTQHLGGRDAGTLATIIAASTRRIRVVPSNLSPFICHPTTTAMMLATLAEYAPGRVAASIGIGNQLDLSQSGIVPDMAEDAVCDFVAALDRLFAREGAVHRAGRTFNLAGAKLSVAAASAVPLYVTALEPRMAKRAAATAAGVQLSAGFSPEFARSCIDAFEAGAAAGGEASMRPRAGFAYFGTDEPSSFEGVRRKLAYLFRNRLMAENIRMSGLPIDQAAIIDCVARHDLEAATKLVPDAAVEAFAVTGGHAACMATVQRFFDAGIDELLINVGSSAAERRAAFSLVAAINS